MTDSDATATGEVGQAPPESSHTAPPTVRRVGEWHLVEASGYQVSVGPDAVIQLPRHIHPRDVPDFIAAITIAADVGNNVYTGNIAAEKNDDRALAQRTALIAAGGRPPGSIKMKVAQRQSEQATIGRPDRRTRAAGRQTATAVKAKQPSAATPQPNRQEKRRAAKKAAEQSEE